MNISAGLAGLKAAADLTKSMRDAAKAGTLKPDEFAGRVGEIYDYIIDSKAALVDTQEENIRLRKSSGALGKTPKSATRSKGNLSPRTTLILGLPTRRRPDRTAQLAGTTAIAWCGSRIADSGRYQVLAGSMSTSVRFIRSMKCQCRRITPKRPVDGTRKWFLPGPSSIRVFAIANTCDFNRGLAFGIKEYSELAAS